jgi:hypothetical protein
VLLAPLVLGTSSAAARGSACPSSNRPDELVLVAVSGQTARLGTQFPVNLQAESANTNGCPLTRNPARISVDFDAPGDGASAILANSGSREAVVGPDAQGIATAPALTANFTARSYTVDAHSDHGSVELYLRHAGSGLPAAITATGTSNEEATVNSQYPRPLQARVTDANGNPVQGASGASQGFLGGGNQATVLTGASGQATSPAFAANATPGSFTATASTAGIASSLTYPLHNRAARLRAGTPTQTAIGEHRYRPPLVVRLLIAQAGPVEGVTVTFTLGNTAGGATTSFRDASSQPTETSDSNGRASSPPLEANGSAATFTATSGLAGGTPLTFRLENRVGAPAAITVGSADGEFTQAGSRFPIRLAVTVTDRQGNPVAHTLVTFSAPARGPSCRFRGRTRVVRVKTDRNGVAVAPPFTANSNSGGYVVTVRAGRPRAAFALVNTRR